jgi:four helix bundle protein
MYTYSFEKLQVWHLAKELVVKIYKITAAFPVEEKFVMVSQMRRAALSICSNLAEGSGRNTPKDQRHFYGMAYSSLMELLNQLMIAESLSWLDAGKMAELRPEFEMISLKINTLRKTIKE